MTAEIDSELAQQHAAIRGDANPGPHIALTVVKQPPYIDVAQALQASFAKADVQPGIQPVAESVLWIKMRSRDFQAIFTYRGANDIDPDTNASIFASNVPGSSKTLAWRLVHSRPECTDARRRRRERCG